MTDIITPTPTVLAVAAEVVERFMADPASRSGAAQRVANFTPRGSFLRQSAMRRQECVLMAANYTLNNIGVCGGHDPMELAKVAGETLVALWDLLGAYESPTWHGAYSGLEVLARRMDRSNGSYWCGYVRLGPGHRFYGKHYADVDVRVHGGWTYSGRSSEHCFSGGYWIGFDCNQLSDERDPKDLAFVQAQLRKACMELGR